jgi:hypothetical protein
MSKKTITILLVILVVLVGVFIIQRSLSSLSLKPKSLSELEMSFVPESVSYIQVFKEEFPDSGLYFARRDTGWIVVNEYGTQAKTGEIQKLLTDIGIVKGAVRAESEDLYPEFSITDNAALQIRLLGADSSLVAHIYVGKGGPDGHSCFVRLPGSPRVYLAENNFVSRFAAWNAPAFKKLPTDRWMNLNLCSLDRNSVSSIKLNTPKAQYEFALVKEESDDTSAAPVMKWQQVLPMKGTRLEESKIRSLQGGISGLNATGVANPANADQFGMDKPSYSVWLADTLGNSTLINFSDKIDTLEERYATVQGRSTVYRVNKGAFEHIFVTPFEKPKESKPKASM